MLRNSVFTGELQSSAFVGTQSDTLYTNVHLGLDYPLIAWHPTETQRYDFGVYAFTHLHTQPRNAKFYVSDLYAGFGIFFSGKVLEWFYWRLFPIYHVSSHIADGYQGNFETDIHGVSNEMVRAEVVTAPVAGLQVGLAGGVYYHTVHRTDLDGVMELSAMYIPPLRCMVKPYAKVLGELIVQYENGPGVDLSVGALLSGVSGRSVGAGFRYYNRPHPGYFALDYQSGYGLEIILSL